MTNAEVARYMQDRFDFLNAKSKAMKKACGTDEQRDEVDDAVTDALNQAAKAQNLQLQANEAKLAEAVKDATAARDSLTKSLKDLKNISKVLNDLTEFIDAGAKILEVFGV